MLPEARLTYNEAYVPPISMNRHINSLGYMGCCVKKGLRLGYLRLKPRESAGDTGLSI
jgi:hypothetical protein